MDKYGLGLALGVFVGNFIFQGLMKHDSSRGFWIGSLAAVIVLVLWNGVRFFKIGL